MLRTDRPTLLVPHPSEPRSAPRKRRGGPAAIPASPAGRALSPSLLPAPPVCTLAGAMAGDDRPLLGRCAITTWWPGALQEWAAERRPAGVVGGAPPPVGRNLVAGRLHLA